MIRLDLTLVLVFFSAYLQPLAKALGIVSVPTVKFFKGNGVVAEVRGAKEDEILKLILQHR